MTTTIATALLLVAGAGLCFMALQIFLLVRHLRVAAPRPSHCPGISVLKPLCGIDDDLANNIASFAGLDYPHYEVLLGVRDANDPAYPIARAAETRWPGLMRIVLQRGEPGLNPKVNQLITMGARARHDILVVSDSNVAAAPGYLGEIAGYLEDPRVGLVTHPVAGFGEQTWGALMDNAHLCSGIAPGMVAAKQIADFPIVVGKSMALRRGDLRALGGFTSVKDVLAEDFVVGRRVRAELGKEVAMAHRPIAAVSRARTLRGFLDRYVRWATIQRKSVGTAQYAGMLVLHPLALAFAAVLVEPGRETSAAFVACWTGKALLEHGAGRCLRSSGFGLRAAAALPLKDGLLLAAWIAGLASAHVTWRGKRLAVVEGTRLVPVSAHRLARLREAPAAMLGTAARLFR